MGGSCSAFKAYAVRKDFGILSFSNCQFGNSGDSEVLFFVCLVVKVLGFPDSGDDARSRRLRRFWTELRPTHRGDASSVPLNSMEPIGSTGTCASTWAPCWNGLIHRSVPISGYAGYLAWAAREPLPGYWKLARKLVPQAEPLANPLCHIFAPFVKQKIRD